MTLAMTPSSGPGPERNGNGMHIDLSGVPGLVQPAPPSNTLLITNLTHSAIFQPASLAAMRTHIEAEVGADAVHAFAPLKSMRRIIVSFTSVEAAVALRRSLDGAELLGSRARLYFGEPTPLSPDKPKHLAAPQADKQFFISPPPSPPHGWTMRQEDPPNKTVHAADLASALAHLDTSQRHHPHASLAEPRDTEMLDLDAEDAEPSRQQSTTVVFEPQMHGGAPNLNLPAVLVEDTTLEQLGPQTENGKEIREHTARPPVELME